MSEQNTDLKINEFYFIKLSEMFVKRRYKVFSSKKR